MLVNAQEQRRVIILTQVVSGALTVAGAAERLALSQRQTKRLLVGFRREGVATLVHGNRGRQPAHPACADASQPTGAARTGGSARANRRQPA